MTIKVQLLWLHLPQTNSSTPTLPMEYARLNSVNNEGTTLSKSECTRFPKPGPRSFLDVRITISRFGSTACTHDVYKGNQGSKDYNIPHRDTATMEAFHLPTATEDLTSAYILKFLIHHDFNDLAPAAQEEAKKALAPDMPGWITLTAARKTFDIRLRDGRTNHSTWTFERGHREWLLRLCIIIHLI